MQENFMKFTDCWYSVPSPPFPFIDAVLRFMSPPISMLHYLTIRVCDKGLC